MADRANKPFVSFVNGEWAPELAAHTDIEEYAKSLSWCENFIVLPTGPIQKRSGTYFRGLTKNNGKGALIPFQFSANDAIMIVATDELFRYYRNGLVIANTPQSISGISKAAQAVVTKNGHGYTNGQEVYITDVVGMPQINGRFFIISDVATNTFKIKDQFGNYVDSTNYDAYVSGGIMATIFETTTPYNEVYLLDLRTAQRGDIMYIVGAQYEPEKLIRSGFTNWSLETFDRTNDPFTGVLFTPTAITKAKPAKVTVASTTGMQEGDTLTLRYVDGMFELNNRSYLARNITGTTVDLYDLNGEPVDSTNYGTYTSNHHNNGLEDVNNWPSCILFTTDSRLAYFNSRKNPQGNWASKLPNGTETRFDDFGTGTPEDYAYAYQYAPVNNEINEILEVKNVGGMVVMLGAGAITQVFGADVDTPPTQAHINTRPTITGAAKVPPIAVDWSLIYVDVTKEKLRGIQFSFGFGSYEAVDYNLYSSHLGLESEFIRLAYSKSVPEIIYVLRADGSLLSLTFNPTQKVFAWAKHRYGGDAKILDIACIRNGGKSQLWMIVERIIEGRTCRSVEYVDVQPVIPAKREFYSGDKSKDYERWASAAWEALKESTFLDMSQTYDGRLRGTGANATLTIGATTGEMITLTSNNAVFEPNDIGRQVWKNYDQKGIGGGRARIVGYTSSTQVTVDVIEDFDNTYTMAPGTWAFAVKKIGNLQLFEGATMSIQADGGDHPDRVVNDGLIELQYECSVVQVGFKYVSRAVTQNLEFGTRQGPGAMKPRNVGRVSAMVSNTIGGFVGTSEYSLDELTFRDDDDVANRPPTPFSGSKGIPLLDNWTPDTKEVVLYHDTPTPCTVLGLDIEVATNEPPV